MGDDIMLRNAYLGIAASCILAAAAGSAHGAGQPFSQSGSITGFASQEADVNGDMEGGAFSRSTQTGTMGKAWGSSTTDLLPWDGFSVCDIDPDSGEPRGLLLTAWAGSAINVAANGDLLFQRLRSSPASTVCFNFLDGESFTFENHWEFVGGTGKYAGATGTSIGRGEGRSGGPHFGARFEEQGTIYLNDPPGRKADPGD
jgi:hypothetical protein